MNLITFDNIVKNYGDRNVLNGVSLGINDGDKIGLIGINGTGKSTFLKILAGFEHEDNGTIIKANKVRIEYLPQNPEFCFTNTVLEQVFKGTSEEMRLLREYENILNKVNVGCTELNSELIKFQSKIDELNLWALESEAKMVLTKLGITDFSKNIGELSGGQRKRIALASALITPSDLLVLDEPTNHMDSNTIDWLEEYLNSRKGALIMITHDRYFLDRVTNKIIELYNGDFYVYEGNYSLYLEKKLERDVEEEGLQRKRESLYRKELAWIKRGAKARSTKQKARIDRFEKLKDDMSMVKDTKMDISVMGSRLGNKVIELKNVSKSYDDKVLIKDFSYTLLKEDKIGIVGDNGVGKTTLMKMLTGEIIPDKGSIELGETVKIACFSQEVYSMDENMRVIDYVKEIGEFLPLSNGDRISASQMLERFLFSPEKQYNFIGKLSGGERRRLYLLKVLMSAPNVLLLDEPTNDLDITTLSILEDFLDGFNGPVIVVSHDRYFLNRVCNKIFAYDGLGNIERLNGDYYDYLEWKAEQDEILRLEEKRNQKEELNKEEKKLESEESKKNKNLKFSYNEKREYEEIDEVIEKLEQKQKQIEKDIEYFSSNFERLNELLKEKEDTDRLLEEKYDRWTYLNDLAEKIEENKNK